MKPSLEKRILIVAKFDPLLELAKELIKEGWTEKTFSSEEHHRIPDSVYWKLRNHIRDVEMGIKRIQ